MTHRLRVLYVDDNDTCELLTTLLGFSGIEVKSTDSFAEALWLAETELFDSYLLATKLPDADGFELCRRLHEFNPQTPIIFYSGEAYASDRQKGLAAGASAYLVKPFFGDLAATILQIITKDKEKPGRTTDSDNIEAFVRLKPACESASQAE